MSIVLPNLPLLLWYAAREGDSHDKGQYASHATFY